MKKSKVQSRVRHLYTKMQRFLPFLKKSWEYLKVLREIATLLISLIPYFYALFGLT